MVAVYDAMAFSTMLVVVLLLILGADWYDESKCIDRAKFIGIEDTSMCTDGSYQAAIDKKYEAALSEFWQE
jgi:hypothetical protein